MAHAALHFAAGAALGMAVAAPAVCRAWKVHQRLAPATARWILAAWAAGFWALVPSVLRHWGAPPALCEGWWMNAFVLHPLLDRLVRGGALVGPAALAAVLALQYAVVLAALRQRRSR
jgi:hypothetical protein